MNLSKGLLIGIIAGVLVSGTLTLSYDSLQADGMSSSSGGMSMGGDGGSSEGMKGGGHPSKHGVFYAPGTTHQECHKGGDMPPHYCEPYYKAMSSVIGVKITNVDPVDEKTLRISLRELSVESPGIHQKISISAGRFQKTGINSFRFLFNQIKHGIDLALCSEDFAVIRYTIF